MHSRLQRAAAAAAIGSTAALVLATAIAAPAAAAAPPVTETFFSASPTDWVVPIGVHAIDYEVIGGSGGNSWDDASLGGAPATVTGVLSVTPGDVLTVWAGEAGAAGGILSGPAGVGGDGYRPGGTGGTAGVSTRPGGGGGGSSAIAVNGTVASSVAGGGGGAGGRGGLIANCPGGDGGDAGAPGNDAQAGDSDCNPTQTGGPAGVDVEVAGQTAVNVPNNVFQNPFLGGAGGGGGGGGERGVLNTTGPTLQKNSGGGGGGGGASLGAVVEVLPWVGDGAVSITYSVAIATSMTVTATPSPAQTGEEVRIVATVANVETIDDPTGTVDFGIAGCASMALVPGTPDDGTATAVCLLTAGEAGTFDYAVVYIPTIDAPFAAAGAELQLTIEHRLPPTGQSASLAPVALGALVLLALGGAAIVARRHRTDG